MNGRMNHIGINICGPSSPTSEPCYQNPFPSRGSRIEPEVSDWLFFERKRHVAQIYIYKSQSCCPDHREERLLGTQILSFKNEKHLKEHK